MASELVHKPLAALIPTVHSLPPPNLDTVTNKQLQEYLENTWGLEETLFTALQENEATFTRTANSLRRPLIFYLAHTAVSYVNKMLVAKVFTKRINPDYESLFAVGVDEMSWDDPDLNENCQWPSLADVRAYRQECFNRLTDFIANNSFPHPIGWKSPWWSLMMGMEHHRIHLETSSVLIRELPAELLKRPPGWIDAPISVVDEVPRNEMIDVSEGTVVLGKDRDFPSYGWDNEYGRKEVRVPPFAASKFKVTNREYLEFVEDGGYDKQCYWSAEGWNWKTSKKVEHPYFWVREGSEWKYRAMFTVEKMPWDWPADVNYHEAHSFCNWKGLGYRVITEAEWHRIRDKADKSGIKQDVVYWDEIPGNLNMKYNSASPVNMFPPNKLGFYDVHGNVWEWAEDFFYGLPGFETHDYYDDFSTPCFDSEHNMMLGGSWISTGDEASIYARYAFRRHFFQHLGFRYVKSNHSMPANCESARPNPAYETDSVVSQYLLFHFGSDKDNMPFDFAPQEALNYPKRIAQYCLDVAATHPINKALDLGCSVGRSCFELAREVPSVLGVDFSARFISCGYKLCDTGFLEFSIPEEGDFTLRMRAEVPEGIDRTRVAFRQGDACNLPHFLGTFDLVLMSNLIDRLSLPHACLQRLATLVNPGGFVIIADPYSWTEDFTPRGNWLSNAEKGETSFDGLNRIMSSDFELIDQTDMSFWLREHKRKFQYGVTHVTAWRRK